MKSRKILKRKPSVALFAGGLLLAACGDGQEPAQGPGQEPGQEIGQQTNVPMRNMGVVSFSSMPVGTDTGGAELAGLEVQPDRGADVPRTGPNSSGVTPDKVPTPSVTGVAGGRPGTSGFAGLTHRDQRNAGTGKYVNTQFSLEPPDQGLCVGNGFVMEAVNTALAIYDQKGKVKLGATALSQFFKLAPEVNRTTPPTFGDFVSDPKCYFDADTDRWFLTVLQQDPAPSVRSHTLVAVSHTGNPTGDWNIFSVDATDDGLNNTPSHPGCPCFGDQPLIGADAHGFYISTNEFGAGTFNGAQVYAMSKQALVAGVLPTVVHIGGLPLAEGISYTLQPATVPPDGDYEERAGGTEYFLSALDFNGTLDNRIAVWALTNTNSLERALPKVKLSNVLVTTEIYGQPPNAVQKPGPTPLADAQMPKAPLELLAGNDDRMNQTVLADGLLWSGVNTIVKAPDGSPRVGIAYFIVKPSFKGGKLSAKVHSQGYVTAGNESVLYPSIGVNGDGGAAMAFTLVGPDRFPSAAYVLVDQDDGPGQIHVAGAGTEPDDGFTAYPAYGGAGVARWGDYSAAVAGPDGSIWMAAEYIPGGPRTVLANWGTYISRVRP